ncbi:MAG: hypothetical protein ACI9TF_000830 [Paracrocinitomix sp.]
MSFAPLWGTVSGIFDSVGVRFGSTDSIAATDFLDAQRGGGRARRLSDLSTMGYERAETRAAPVIEQYCKRFGIEPETERMTGP